VRKKQAEKKLVAKIRGGTVEGKISHRPRGSVRKKMDASSGLVPSSAEVGNLVPGERTCLPREMGGAPEIPRRGEGKGKCLENSLG